MTFRGRAGASGAAGNSCLERLRDRCSNPQEDSDRPGRTSPLHWGRLLFLATVAGFAPAAILAGPQHSSPPPPHSSAPQSHPSSGSHSGAHPPGNQHPPTNKQHLGEWLQKNQGLSTDEQVKKLQQEQGFNRLTPQQQQSATNRLRQLNQMPPEQRQKVLERVENMERLSPQQQDQVRGSARQLGQMPPDRQQAVKAAIRSLKNVPPGERQSELNSRYGSQLSPQERGIAANLLSVETYHPPAAPPQP